MRSFQWNWFKHIWKEFMGRFKHCVLCVSLGGCHVGILSVFSTGGFVFWGVSKKTSSQVMTSVCHCVFISFVWLNSASRNTDKPGGTDIFHQCAMASSKHSILQWFLSRRWPVCEAGACVCLCLFGHMCVHACHPVLLSSGRAL